MFTVGGDIAILYHDRYHHTVQTQCTLSGAFESKVHPCTLGYMSIAGNCGILLNAVNT